jgi:hypothetical protein
MSHELLLPSAAESCVAGKSSLASQAAAGRRQMVFAASARMRSTAERCAGLRVAAAPAFAVRATPQRRSRALYCLLRITHEIPLNRSDWP